MIRNKTKNTVVAKRFFRKNRVGKLIGLMGQKTPKTLVFKTRFGIHTFFLKFDIDVMVLDKNKKVILTKKGVKPNKIIIWNLRFDTVIELPSGFIEKSQTKKGDLLEFKL